MLTGNAEPEQGRNAPRATGPSDAVLRRMAGPHAGRPGGQLRTDAPRVGGLQQIQARLCRGHAWANASRQPSAGGGPCAADPQPPPGFGRWVAGCPAAGMRTNNGHRSVAQRGPPSWHRHEVFTRLLGLDLTLKEHKGVTLLLMAACCLGSAWTATHSTADHDCWPRGVLRLRHVHLGAPPTAAR
jgi:hypothetical protein